MGLKSMHEHSADQQQGTDIVLSVDKLSVSFNQGYPINVVDNLSFSLSRNKTLAIVGESGSGKSITSLALLGLVKHIGGVISEGRLHFQSDVFQRQIDLATLDEQQLAMIRGNEIAMIFQEPMTSMNPVFTIGSQIAETLMLHQGISYREALTKARDLLDLVRLPNAGKLLHYYPHQLSGGMRQRAMIAMALSCQPKVLIADEPTTALDVTIQAQVLHIIRDLQAEFETAVIFISHDMGVVSQMADDVLVMRASRQVESGSVSQVFNQPKADYTRELLAAVPKIGSMKGEVAPKLFHLPGEYQPSDLNSLESNSGNVSENSSGNSSYINRVDYSQPIIELDQLTTRYDLRGGLFNRVTHRIHAVEKLSLQLYPGETLALVGESGSGKSTVGKTIQQLVDPLSGTVRFRGTDIFSLPKHERKQFRREIQYVFQDPYGSLNPRKTVGESIIEPAVAHQLIQNEQQKRTRISQLLEKVGLQSSHADRYPHEFSGGQRQRICIARSLACNPSLIIADEAVSALDVSVQAQVINLLMQLQAEQGLAYLFITHDMAVVERVSHRVAVMYLGQIVELGSRQQIFENPQHSYTKRLLAAVPVVDPEKRGRSVPLEGEIPSAMRSVGDEPVIHQYREIDKGHFVALEAVAFH